MQKISTKACVVKLLEKMTKQQCTSIQKNFFPYKLVEILYKISPVTYSSFWIFIILALPHKKMLIYFFAIVLRYNVSEYDKRRFCNKQDISYSVSQRGNNFGRLYFIQN
jgi:hypothetical protein